jgi:alpha-glucosidase
MLFRTPNTLLRVLLLLVFFCSPAFAQDERRVVSPDGKVEFYLFVNGQEESNLSRVAYQVRVSGKVLVDTSFMGFDIYTWEPLLGENTGLISDSSSANVRYHSLTARYMQNGSLARRLDVEVRVYNDGVAFRYVIGKAVSTERLQIADESTEFELPHDPATPLTLPFMTQQKGIGWVALTEVPLPGFPRMHLAHEDSAGKILLTRLARHDGPVDVVYDGQPPLTTPWRVFVLGHDREHLAESDILRDLSAPDRQ